MPGARGAIGRDRADAASGPVHARPAEPRPPLPVAERRARRTAIGVRVATLPAQAQRVLDAVGAVVATSANEAGGRDPVTLDDVPASIRAACAAELDVGRLGGTPSTVIDFSGPTPVVLREGAAPSAAAIARVSDALSGSAL